MLWPEAAAEKGSVALSLRGFVYDVKTGLLSEVFPDQ
jgi:hypothetical protein